MTEQGKAPAARTDHFVVMCDEGTTEEHSGDRTGTVVAIYPDQEAADDALADVYAKAHVQRRDYEEWARISYEENPIKKLPLEDLAKLGGAIIDRNKRRNEWMKTHPMPPTDLMYRFWVVRIEAAEPAEGRPSPEIPAIPDSKG